MFTGHPDLRRALTSPGVPLGAKQSVMRDVLALQPVSKVVARLLTLVVENDDIDEIDEIVEAFEQRVLDLHQVVRAEITSAVPLPADKVQAIEASLATACRRPRRDHAARRPGPSRRRRRQGRQPRLRRQRRPSPRPDPRPSRQRRLTPVVL